MGNPTIDEALSQAHLPALLMALVHLTGDADLLSEERRPVFEPLADPALGGFSEEIQSDLRRRAKTAIEAHLAGAPLPPPPTPQTVRRMMDWLTGADIPAHYAPFLTDELQLTGNDTKAPDWSAPNLRSAAKTMNAIVIGAGMSGILAGIRLQQAGIDFTILEKNAEAGGTWFENTYPGCRVDNPNHMYSYSFEPNHDFPQFYSTQPVLLNYFQGVASKYNLHGRIRFGTEVEGAEFDEERAIWRVTIKGSREVLEASVLITAVGQLNRPRYPDIDGTETFRGEAFHSARWHNDVDLSGKRVAVIGTGASAFQFVPRIAPTVSHLDVFPAHTAVASARPELPPGTCRRVRSGYSNTCPSMGKWYRFWLFWLLTDGFYDAVKVRSRVAGRSGSDRRRQRGVARDAGGGNPRPVDWWTRACSTRSCRPTPSGASDRWSTTVSGWKP